MIPVRHIDHVALAVSDLEASTAWYQDLLGLERRFQHAWGDEPPVMLCAGDTCLALFPTVGAPLPPPGKDTIAMRHVCFLVDRPAFDAARAELDARSIAWTFADHDVSHSLYLSDPDGHTIELTTYEL